MRRIQRKHLYPIIWVLIFGLTNAGGRTDDTENVEILTEMDSNGEKKTNSTDVEITSGEIATKTSTYEAEDYYEAQWYEDYMETFISEMERSWSQLLEDISKEMNEEMMNTWHPNMASRPIGPQPPDQAYTSDKCEEADEEFEASTIVTLAIGATILFIAGSIGAGYCYSGPPSRSETRSSSLDLQEALSESRSEGVISENKPLVGENPVKNQNNTGTIV